MGNLIPSNVSEWAAAVQAITSTVAIVAAIRIASQQHRQQLRLDMDRELRRARVTTETIRVLAELYEEELKSWHAMISSVESWEELSARTSRMNIDDVFATTEVSVRALPMHQLANADCVNIVARLLNQIKTSRSALRQALSNSTRSAATPFSQQMLAIHLTGARAVLTAAQEQVAAISKAGH